MAKPKTKNTKGIVGYGMPSPTAKIPSDMDQRAAPSPALGDYYGTGKRNPMGRNRSSNLGNPVSRSNLKKPPKSLA